MRKKKQHCIQFNTQINGMYSSLSISFSFFWLYFCISVSQPLYLVELVFLHSFTFWLSFSMIPSSYFSFLHFASGFQTGIWENLIHWKGPNKSLRASKCLWKYFLNVHIVTDISHILCEWIHEYSETIKCFLHCATYLKRNRQTEKIYF